MDPTEITKHIPEIASATKVVAAAIPFTAIVKRMLGPAADELAEMWRDQVRLYRYERQLKCVQKAERMAQEAGFTPQAVPPKILFPLLEGASLEENEDLHDMWAALLANAASPRNAEKVRPGFIVVLRQLSAEEASLLDWIEGRVRSVGQTYRPIKEMFEMLESESSPWREEYSQSLAVDPSDAPVSNLGVALDSLEAVQLVRRISGSSFPGLRSGPFAPRMDKRYVITDRGIAFLSVCRPPKSKEVD